MLRADRAAAGRGTPDSSRDLILMTVKSFMRPPSTHARALVPLLLLSRAPPPLLLARRDASPTLGLKPPQQSDPLPTSLGRNNNSVSEPARASTTAARLPGAAPPHELQKRLTLSEATPQDWRLVVDALAPFMRAAVSADGESRYAGRRANLHLVVENLADPFNAQSVCRTAEALGVQHVHVIESICPFQLPGAEAHASSRGALGRGDTGEGAARWLSIHKHQSAGACVNALRAAGVKILVSDCPTDDGTEESGSGEAENDHAPSRDNNPAHEGMGFVVDPQRTAAAKPIDELDWDGCFTNGHNGAALVFGNERRGVSRVLIENADGAFYLPMSGFTQSFNVGVALGMSLMAAVSTGRFPTGTLSEDARAELLGRWLLRDIKASEGLLAQAGIGFDDF